ncbi:MAG: DMT family transporter [Nitrospirales bacterium]|nr:EamA family transporter [Nitrospira sp.]MDR4501726.1 DMT family transporter [Nitrospirales bacterium]
MSVKTPAVAYASLTTAAVVWGGSVVAQKVALGPFSPVEVSVLRGFGALLILFPLWLWRERCITFTGRDIGVFAILGLTVLANHLLVLFGLNFIGAGAAGIIIGAGPAITAFLSSVILRDLPFRQVWVGCTVSFVGVLLVSGTNGSAEWGGSPLLGGSLILLSLVSWALYTIGSRRVMERFSSLTVNWTTLLISLLLQIPLLTINQKVFSSGVEVVPLSGWLALFYVIVFATALGQQAWLYGVEGVGPARAGIFVNVIPVSALILSFFILNESIGWIDVLGISFILTGVWLVNRQSAV